MEAPSPASHDDEDELAYFMRVFQRAYQVETQDQWAMRMIRTHAVLNTEVGRPADLTPATAFQRAQARMRQRLLDKKY